MNSKDRVDDLNYPLTVIEQVDAGVHFRLISVEVSNMEDEVM